MHPYPDDTLQSRTITVLWAGLVGREQVRAARAGLWAQRK